MTLDPKDPAAGNPHVTDVEHEMPHMEDLMAFLAQVKDLTHQYGGDRIEYPDEEPSVSCAASSLDGRPRIFVAWGGLTSGLQLGPDADGTPFASLSKHYAPAVADQFSRAFKPKSLPPYSPPTEGAALGATDSQS